MEFKFFLNYILYNYRNVYVNGLDIEKAGL